MQILLQESGGLKQNMMSKLKTSIFRGFKVFGRSDRIGNISIMFSWKSFAVNDCHLIPFPLPLTRSARQSLQQPSVAAWLWAFLTSLLTSVTENHALLGWHHATKYFIHSLSKGLGLLSMYVYVHSCSSICFVASGFMWEEIMVRYASEFILLPLTVVTSSINPNEPVPQVSIHAHAVTLNVSNLTWLGMLWITSRSFPSLLSFNHSWFHLYKGSGSRRWEAYLDILWPSLI